MEDVLRTKDVTKRIASSILVDDTSSHSKGKRKSKPTSYALPAPPLAMNEEEPSSSSTSSHILTASMQSFESSAMHLSVDRKQDLSMYLPDERLLVEKVKAENNCTLLLLPPFFAKHKRNKTRIIGCKHRNKKNNKKKRKREESDQEEVKEEEVKEEEVKEEEVKEEVKAEELNANEFKEKSE